MWNNEKTLYSVEYKDLHESRFEEVDQIIEDNKGDGVLDGQIETWYGWETSPSYTIFFSPEGEIKQIKAWGYDLNGDFVEEVVTL